MKQPKIIDADEKIDQCDMNYDYDLIIYQTARQHFHLGCFTLFTLFTQHSMTQKEDEDPVEIEKDSKKFLENKLQNII